MMEMTVAQVAELCGQADRTVRDWVGKAAADFAAETAAGIRRKQEAAGHGKATGYSLPEVLFILRAGGKNLLASLLEEKAAREMPAQKPRLPNGIQLHELRLLAESKVLSPYQIQLVLGVAVPRPQALPEVPASIEEGAEAFETMARRFPKPGLPAMTVARAVGAGAAATRRTLEKFNAEAEASTLQGALPLEGGR